MEKIRKALTFDDVQLVPRYSEILSRNDINCSTRFTNYKNVKLPIIAAPMDTVCGLEMCKKLMELGAVGIVHRFMSIEDQVNSIKLLKAHAEYIDISAPRTAAIPVNGNSRERFEKLLEAGANVFVIDVANGHHILVKEMMQWLNARTDRHTFDIIAGSIATRTAALDLESWGADALRVGIGGGSVCETRIRTGIGIPQLQAVIDVCDSDISIPVISDGGIRLPGDAAKALAAGADSIMVGSLLSGTDESPGDYVILGEWPYTKKYKMYRGMASATTKMKYTGTADYVEGASKLVESKGSVTRIINDIKDGIASSMSYVGAANLMEFRTKSEFVKITSAGLAEAHPHLL